jgi:hypothetical protein
MTESYPSLEELKRLLEEPGTTAKARNKKRRMVKELNKKIRTFKAKLVDIQRTLQAQTSEFTKAEEQLKKNPIFTLQSELETKKTKLKELKDQIEVQTLAVSILPSTTTATGSKETLVNEISRLLVLNTGYGQQILELKHDLEMKQEKASKCATSLLELSASNDKLQKAIENTKKQVEAVVKEVVVETDEKIPTDVELPTDKEISTDEEEGDVEPTTTNVNLPTVEELEDQEEGDVEPTTTNVNLPTVEELEDQEEGNVEPTTTNVNLPTVEELEGEEDELSLADENLIKAEEDHKKAVEYQKKLEEDKKKAEDNARNTIKTILKDKVEHLLELYIISGNKDKDEAKIKEKLPLVLNKINSVSFQTKLDNATSDDLTKSLDRLENNGDIFDESIFDKIQTAAENNEKNIDSITSKFEGSELEKEIQNIGAQVAWIYNTYRYNQRLRDLTDKLKEKLKSNYGKYSFLMNAIQRSEQLSESELEQLKDEEAKDDIQEIMSSEDAEARLLLQHLLRNWANFTTEKTEEKNKQLLENEITNRWDRWEDDKKERDFYNQSSDVTIDKDIENINMTRYFDSDVIPGENKDHMLESIRAIVDFLRLKKVQNELKQRFPNSDDTAVLESLSSLLSKYKKEIEEKLEEFDQLFTRRMIQFDKDGVKDDDTGSTLKETKLERLRDVNKLKVDYLTFAQALNDVYSLSLDNELKCCEEKLETEVPTVSSWKSTQRILTLEKERNELDEKYRNKSSSKLYEDYFTDHLQNFNALFSSINASIQTLNDTEYDQTKTLYNNKLAFNESLNQAQTQVNELKNSLEDLFETKYKEYLINEIVKIKVAMLADVARIISPTFSKEEKTFGQELEEKRNQVINNFDVEYSAANLDPMDESQLETTLSEIQYRQMKNKLTKKVKQVDNIYNLYQQFRLLGEDYPLTQSIKSLLTKILDDSLTDKEIQDFQKTLMDSQYFDYSNPVQLGKGVLTYHLTEKYRNKVNALGLLKDERLKNYKDDIETLLNSFDTPAQNYDMYKFSLNEKIMPNLSLEVREDYTCCETVSVFDSDLVTLANKLHTEMNKISVPAKLELMNKGLEDVYQDKIDKEIKDLQEEKQGLLSITGSQLRTAIENRNRELKAKGQVVNDTITKTDVELYVEHKVERFKEHSAGLVSKVRSLNIETFIDELNENKLQALNQVEQDLKSSIQGAANSLNEGLIEHDVAKISGGFVALKNVLENTPIDIREEDYVIFTRPSYVQQAASILTSGLSYLNPFSYSLFQAAPLTEEQKELAIEVSADTQKKQELEEKFDQDKKKISDSVDQVFKTIDQYKMIQDNLQDDYDQRGKAGISSIINATHLQEELEEKSFEELEDLYPGRLSHLKTEVDKALVNLLTTYRILTGMTYESSNLASSDVLEERYRAIKDVIIEQEQAKTLASNKTLYERELVRWIENQKGMIYDEMNRNIAPYDQYDDVAKQKFKMSLALRSVQNPANFTDEELKKLPEHLLQQKIQDEKELFNNYVTKQLEKLQKDKETVDKLENLRRDVQDKILNLHGYYQAYRAELATANNELDSIISQLKDPENLAPVSLDGLKTLPLAIDFGTASVKEPSHTPEEETFLNAKNDNTASSKAEYDSKKEEKDAWGRVLYDRTGLRKNVYVKVNYKNNPEPVVPVDEKTNLYPSTRRALRNMTKQTSSSSSSSSSPSSSRSSSPSSSRSSSPSATSRMTTRASAKKAKKYNKTVLEKKTPAELETILKDEFSQTTIPKNKKDRVQKILDLQK